MLDKHLLLKELEQKQLQIIQLNAVIEYIKSLIKYLDEYKPINPSGSIV